MFFIFRESMQSAFPENLSPRSADSTQEVPPHPGTEASVLTTTPPPPCRLHTPHEKSKYLDKKMVTTLYTSHQQGRQTQEKEEMKKAAGTTQTTFYRRVVTEPLPVPDIFGNSSRLFYTYWSQSSEKTEQRSVQLIDDTFPYDVFKISIFVICFLFVKRQRMSLSAIVVDIVVGDMTSVRHNLVIGLCICLQLKSLEKLTWITKWKVFFCEKTHTQYKLSKKYIQKPVKFQSRLCPDPETRTENICQS